MGVGPHREVRNDNRRDFVKTIALSGMAVAASDVVGDLIAQSPQGRVLESKFKGLSDVALMEAKRAGCTYADIRFTRRTNSGVNANGGNRDAADVGGFGGGRAAGGAGDAAAGRTRRVRWIRRRRRQRAGPARAAARPPASACA